MRTVEGRSDDIQTLETRLEILLEVTFSSELVKHFFNPVHHPTRPMSRSMHKKFTKHIKQRCTDFPKIEETPQNSRGQNGNTKQVPQRGSTNIWCHRTKFNRHGVLALGFVNLRLTGFVQLYDLPGFKTT